MARRWAPRRLGKVVAGLAGAALIAAGVAVAAPGQAIVGGEPSDRYPWAVGFLKADDGTSKLSRYRCSGTLIKKSWVLTAGHCMAAFAGKGDRGLKVGDTAVIGRTDLEAVGTGQVRTIAEIRMFITSGLCPADRSEERCDVALVKLDSPVDVKDADLAGPDVLSQWGVGTEARVYGYGADCGKPGCGPRLVLWRGHVEVTSMWSDHYTVLAESRDGSQVCYGDSGGTLVVSTSSGPRVVGVTRAGSGCETGTVGYYAKVGWRGSAQNSPVYRWITENT